ncbi:MAG TPA: glycosyltransferase [Acidobacteriaceae bacterium]
MSGDSSIEREPIVAMRARIFAVIVLYKQHPSASVTVATLARALENASLDCAVLVYENSAENSAQSAKPQASGTLPPGFRYHPAVSNRGLLGAYESALQQARAEGYDWLLTLDQDTSLPLDFFSAIQPGLQAAADDPHIAAIVPHLAEGERLLSPAYVGIGRATPLPVHFSGVPQREARAFNSAALLRVKSLDAIGGFDPCFWLDHFDSSLHHRLYVHGWRMFVLDSVHLEHHFSLLNYKERVSLPHFQNYLLAESAYMDLYSSWWARAAYTAQLGVRLVNQHRRREYPEILQATRAALLRRLTMTRVERLRRWRQEMSCREQR